uniref:TOG domain-containing protein n=1 Tax=Chenopodium quinoa TaxID=63459 RepID=A0A803LAG8_CHEQI
MEEALELARAKDTKQRMAAVERLHHLLESSRKPLSSSEVTSLVDTCLDLLKDNNFRVSQGSLLALASAAVISGDHFKIHFNSLVPATVERLGDAKQPVRDAARRLLLTLMEVSSPTIIVERAGSYAWEHKSWRVREEFARTVTSAMNLFASTELPLQRAILPPILHMLNDPNHSVREATISCIEEMYMQIGPQFQEELQRHQLPSYMVKDINARLERIEPKPRSSDGAVSSSIVNEHKVTNHNPKRNSPKAKNSSRETSLFGADGDVTEKPVDPVKVYSEKELIREFEKIASTLVPEKDWSHRIAAMQRFEGLVIGGAADYPCFRGLLKQLIGPLSTQLSDRRSSIVKQACHLLNFLSKELLGDFEACAEHFIPVLFKLVVITVLVIAESADNCIKTMLRNCKVARVLPRIADCAKNDRNAALRARCCDYALLVLEHWPDEPEIQRAADLYEDMIRRCVGDAVSEVRTTARACYRMFAKTWPDRSRRLFQSFDPVIQRIINEEDGGLHRRHASPSVRERNVPNTPQSSASLNMPGYGTSAIVAMDKTATLSSRASVSSGMLLSQSKSLDKGSDRSLESVLNSSKEKVSAIESLLRGLDLSSKHNSSTIRSSSLDLGVDPPSSRDPPYPLAVPASNQVTSLSLDSKLSSVTGNKNRNGGMAHSDMYSHLHASKDAGKLSYLSGLMNEPSSTLMSYSAKRASERAHERNFTEDQTDIRDSRRYMNSHMDRQYADTPYRESTFRDSSYVPNFQRPLSRKNVTGRSTSSSRRRSFDDSHLPLGETPSFVEGPASLHEALGEGLSPSSDWCARVAAFNYIRSLLQQGPSGIQDIVQNFEKVMKLFFKHLDDPHHKVAQAALLTLAEIIPACRRPFESYMERILPHVFSRLIDPKEVVRQPCSTTLDIVGKTYGVDSLLPALLRSLDEQRSPKAKLAVIEFAIGSFNKNSVTSEGAGNIGILKLWLAKLTPLVHDKNTKLKEAAISCFISVYTHYDPTNVLNFILSLSVEEQNSLRRALKQYTPRIEVDLMNYLQSKKERQRSKAAYDPSDVVGTSSEEGYMGVSKKTSYFGRYSANSPDSDGGRKWNPMLDSTYSSGRTNHATTDESHANLYESHESGSGHEILDSRIKDKYMGNNSGESVGYWASRLENVDSSDNPGVLSTPRMDTNGLKKSSDSIGASAELQHENGFSDDLATDHTKTGVLKIASSSESGLSIPQVLHSICNGNEGSSADSRQSAIHQLIKASVSNDSSMWSKYFNQILTAVLEVLDDPESSVKELVLLLIAEMLRNQKEAMEESVEIVMEKLLHVSKDTAPKVANEAENCLTTLLAQYYPFRCLSVIVPLLVAEDEKTLVASINCLTKLVGRLSQEELMNQLPSFLPALFDAFGNQSADVRKGVAFVALLRNILDYILQMNLKKAKPRFDTTVCVVLNSSARSLLGEPGKSLLGE